MRFTPSTNWNTVAASSNRVVTWTVSIKQTASLSEALSSGTWVDVTSFVTELPSIEQSIEFELGQFSSSSISFTGRNIDWWEANVFNASDYIELKITATISNGAIVTSDTFYAFSGFVDKVGVTYDELQDTVSFDVFTADELGNRISAENLATQYISSSGDKLILPNIPGIYVVDADVASYPLKVGLHTIEFEYNGGTERARLDGGAWLTLTTSDGLDTLVSLDGLEKLQIYVYSGPTYNRLSSSADTLTDYVIVTTFNDTLPKQPYSGISLRQTLKNLYALVGIDTVTFDTLQFTSNDSSAKFSYYDTPPQDISKTGEVVAITDNGTDIFVGVGDTVYKRTMSSDSYTSVTTKANYTVRRLWYESNNNDLWIWFDGATNYVRVYDLTGASSAEVDVSNNTSHTSADLFYNADFYGLIYTNASNRDVRIVDDSATDSEIFSATTMGYAASYGALSIFLFVNGSKVIFRTIDATDDYYHEIEDVAATWNDNGQVVTLDPAELYTITYPAALHKSENRIYYGTDVAGDIHIKSHTTTSGTVTDVTSFSATTYGLGSMLYANSVVYYIRNGNKTNGGNLFSLATNAATSVSTTTNTPSVTGYTMTYFGSTLYGISQLRRLWRYSSTLNMYLEQLVPTGTVASAIQSVLQSFNLVGVISSHKKAFVYRRGNDSGTIQTTGNSITLTTSNVSQIEKVANDFQKILWVQVTSDDTVYSYDGTTYNAGILSDSRKFEMTNDLIPEDLVQDVAKYLFTFYNTAHDRYMFNVDVPKMEYEVMDGAAVTFSTTRITKTATGLITSQSINNDGTMQIGVIF